VAQQEEEDAPELWVPEEFEELEGAVPVSEDEPLPEEVKGRGHKRKLAARAAVAAGGSARQRGKPATGPSASGSSDFEFSDPEKEEAKESTKHAKGNGHEKQAGQGSIANGTKSSKVNEEKRNAAEKPSGAHATK
jgi:hypothetical protein